MGEEFFEFRVVMGNSGIGVLLDRAPGRIDDAKSSRRGKSCRQ